ncbi:DUF4290 domain-containing protein [Saccharicrinis fermentans]|uniref:DUF4290 domain-containing protein n=1 Tax=Saccharicrinis fermentans DSM 9555 = JCM 21142 TaxID=869213 RepID=W7YAS1_9BACT|nr:DUF4290 domain-containing protein [Saccharicrinis fermentans]GAF04683.1 hypothetical protein JCM21142_93398 [Saccharicrinis fermentans DSM 9555 = JCM 21142]
MDYNSNRKKLLLPEYGRHIQKMVDHCVSIQDKEERTKCAHSIIGNMGNMFPHLRDVNDFKHKLWDHLAIMSEFKLEIETPFALPEKETLYEKPKKMPYNNQRIRYRHYGRTIEHMIDKAGEMEDGEHKQHLIMLIANNMKKSLITWNKDFPGDERIFNDMRKMSDGKLEISDDMKIPEQKENQGYQPQSRNKKKRPFKRHDDRRN